MSRRFVVMVHNPETGADALDIFDSWAEAHKISTDVVGKEIRYPVCVGGVVIGWRTAGTINGSWVVDRRAA